MRLLLIGDLHAHPWEWFPTVKGENEYMRRVRSLLYETVPSIVAQQDIDAVVLMGDLADDVARTGRVYVTVLNLLRDAIQHLASAIPQVYIIKGNHDSAGGQDWLAALEGGRVTVVHDAQVIADIAMIAWNKQARVQSALQAAEKDGCRYVLGHWFLPGARADNGYELDPSGAISGPWKSRFDRILLGDIHTPQGSEDDKVIYVGSPLRHSRASKDIGDRRLAVFDSSTNMVSFQPHACPAFVGPTDDMGVLSALPNDSFVRFLVGHDNLELIDQLRKQYPKLRIEPELKDPAKGEAPALRVDLLQDEPATKDNPSQEKRAQILHRYVKHAKECGTLPDAPISEARWGKAIEELLKGEGS